MKTPHDAAAAADAMEAQIRARSQPVLSADERKALGLRKAHDDLVWAAARARAAAAEQTARADALDAQAKALAVGDKA